MSFQKMRVRALLVTGVCLLASGAEADFGDQGLKGLAITGFTRNDGLPQNGITALATDRQGFLWVGTQAGLARFDGVSFRVMEKSNTPLMEDHFISSLLATSSGELWIGTRSELLVRARDGSLRRLDESDGLPREYVRSLLEDSQGQIWLGTYGGGLCLLKGTRPQCFGASEGLGNGVVRALAEDSRGLWIGTSKGIYRMIDGEIEHFRADGPLAEVFVRSLLVDRSGVLWVGARDRGLWMVEGEEAIERSRWAGIDPDTTVWTVVEDRHGAMLVAGESFGVHRIGADGVDDVRASDGLANDVVLCLLEDSEGNLWVGTRAGLNQLKKTAVSNLTSKDGLSNDFVRTVYQDSNGGLWVGSERGLDHWPTVEGGLSESGRRRWLENLEVRSILQASDGVLWVGTRSGLFHRQGDSFVVFQGRLPGNTINALAEDLEGCLWVGASDGDLARICNGVVRPPGIRILSRVVRTIQVDAEGTVWCGTENGLVGYMGEETRAITGTYGLPGDFVFAIHIDAHNALWVGTNDGLARVFDGRVHPFGREVGLPVDQVFQILEDDLGRLWLSTPRGLLRVSKELLTRQAAGEDVQLDHVWFDESDGMASSECNGGSQPAAWKSTDGRLWFATFSGVAVVDPNAVIRDLPSPAPVFDRLLADGLEVASGEEMHLSPDVQEIELEYTAPFFYAPRKLRFRYRLDGFHDGWILAGERRGAHFGSLRPKHYRFRVQAAGSDRRWGEEEATISFRILPHLWQTRWFMALVAILFLGSGPLIYRVRIAQAERRQRALAKLVEQRTFELEAANLQLERLASIDFLTQVANHRRFRQTLDDEWRRHMRNSLPLSLIIVDVDFFKAFNDLHGHQHGDEVLFAVAQALTESASRSADLVARYGGEEFAVILPETDRNGALRVAESLRAGVQNLGIEHEGAVVGGVLTVSAGVATKLPATECRVEDLVAAADNALYAAKRAGRNRVCQEGCE